MNSNQTGLLSPSELFNRLVSTDYRPVECEDEAAKLHAQRQILIQLICEYEDEIKKAHMLAMEEQQLGDMRERMIAELQALKSERSRIDVKLSQDLSLLKRTPVELRDHESWMMEINDSRSRNSGLRVRIKDLMLYIEKLQLQNRRLEEEKRILQASDMNRFQAKEDWRLKIDLLQKEYLSYETDIRERIRMKEEEAMKSIHLQEMEIQERNERRRTESLSGKVYSSHGRVIPTPMAPMGAGGRPMYQYPYARNI